MTRTSQQDGAVEKGAKFNSNVESILNFFLTLSATTDSDAKVLQTFELLASEMEEVSMFEITFSLSYTLRPMFKKYGRKLRMFVIR